MNRNVVVSALILMFSVHSAVAQKTITGFSEVSITEGDSKLIDGVERTQPDIYYVPLSDGTYRAMRLTVKPGEPARMTVPYIYMTTSHSVCVSWKSSADDAGSVVRYGSDESNLNASVVSDSKRIAGTYYWNSALIDNLEPDAVYYYRVEGKGGTSATYRFRTMPLPGSMDKIRVLLIGDHQRNERSDYEWMLNAARKTVAEKYGDAPFEDNIRFIMNVGDQVDAGRSELYESVHLFKSRSVSPSLPTMTAVGNHEYREDSELSRYKGHYRYDTLSYAGISSGTASYYAYQVGRTLFVVLDSDDPSAAQKMWVRKVIAAAAVDENVDFIVSVQHRPLYAEQYSGDVSPWMLNEIMPILSSTPKHVLNYAGHHHLYARGQMTDVPVYHIISGGGVGTSAEGYEQLWGKTPDNYNHEEVQKTIDHWTYQIAEFDPATLTMTVETYSIGNSRLALDNVLVDRFVRRLDDNSAPAVPVIAPVGGEVSLPYAFTQTNPTDDVASVEYQISRNADFTDIVLNRLTNCEDFYGVDDKYMPLDINAGKDITSLSLESGSLPNGTYYIRTRNRNDNLQWSDYSAPVSFTVTGSAVQAALSLDGRFFRTGSEVVFNYDGAPVGTDAWVGIYVYGKTPGTADLSYKYAYTDGVSGAWRCTIDEPGAYFAVLFKDGEYTEITDRVNFVVSDNCDDSTLPSISTDKKVYAVGEPVVVNYDNAPCIDRDWIGIYERSVVPVNSKCPTYAYVGGSPQGSLTLNVAGTINFTSALKDGIYFAGYFNADGYYESCARAPFVIGKPVILEAGCPEYSSTDNVEVFYEGLPCFGDEQVAVFGTSGLCASVPVKAEGGMASVGSLPAGDYELCVVTGDMKEISSRVALKVTAPTGIGSVSGSRTTAVLSDGKLYVSSPEGVRSVDVYDASGRTLCSRQADGSGDVVIPFRPNNSVFIVNVNGNTACKVVSGR